jgi:hypothetical protein
MKNGIEVFLSSARSDQSLLDKLVEHLSIMEREGLIHLWNDCNVSPGIDWRSLVRSHLQIAQLILFLISPAFITSDFWDSQEMEDLLKRHERGEVRIIPILLRPVEWNKAPLNSLQVLPLNKEPVTCWRHREKAFLDIAQGVRAAIKELAPWPSIDAALLAVLNRQKENCRQANVPFHTPSLFLALLDIPEGVTSLALESLQSGLTDHLRETLRSYVFQALPTYQRSFSDFHWEEREDVQKAQQWARKEDKNIVTERHLFLGILEAKSNTQQSLKNRLGEEKFQTLVHSVQRASIQSLGTPGIASFFEVDKKC